MKFTQDDIFLLEPIVVFNQAGILHQLEDVIFGY